jgi:hypothetical protein
VTRIRLSRIFWIGAAAILVAAALVALVAVLRGDFSDTDVRILVTLAALLYTGGAALAGLALVDRARGPWLGWLVAVAAPVCLGFVLWAIWSFVGNGGGNENADRLAWSAVLALLAGLISTTALLLARRRELVALAVAAGLLAGLAALLAGVGIWTEPDSDTFAKVMAAVWILAALCYFLVPVLQRFRGATVEPTAFRILGELDGVELIASRDPVKGVAVEAPRPGELLVLRRRA